MDDGNSVFSATLDRAAMSALLGPHCVGLQRGPLQFDVHDGILTVVSLAKGYCPYIVAGLRRCLSADTVADCFLWLLSPRLWLTTSGEHSHGLERVVWGVFEAIPDTFSTQKEIARCARQSVHGNAKQVDRLLHVANFSTQDFQFSL